MLLGLIVGLACSRAGEQSCAAASAVATVAWDAEFERAAKELGGLAQACESMNSSGAAEGAPVDCPPQDALDQVVKSAPVYIAVRNAETHEARVAAAAKAAALLRDRPDRYPGPAPATAAMVAACDSALR